MNKDEIRKKIIRYLKDHYDPEVNREISDNFRIDNLGIDSLDRIELIMGLEEEFNIKIKDEEEFNTVGDLINKLSGHQIDLRETSSKFITSKKYDFLQPLKIDKSDVERAGFNPYYMSAETGLGRIVTMGGKNLISFGSNDYLGIANGPELKKAAIEALERFGISMCGTPIVIGQTSLNKALEKRIAQFVGTDDALVFPSGYQANTGIFQDITTVEDIIIADKFAHYSLLTGLNLSKAKKRLFKHNDAQDLEKILEKAQDYRMRFVVVEGLYSTEGDISPLKEITCLAKKHNAFVIVDDAHGIGVLGKKGRGILEHCDVFGEVDLVTGSLGKALGCFGVFIATNAELADIFRYKMGSLIYSTALPPAIAAASLASIDLVENSILRREQLANNKKRMYESLKDLGYNLTPSSTPLFSVICGSNYDTLLFSKKLYDNGIYGTPFLAPSVPEGRALVRFIPHANLTNDDISKAIEVFKKIR
jgi:8-amino-7-oxononanoate synthase/acyl carrier protein